MCAGKAGKAVWVAAVRNAWCVDVPLVRAQLAVLLRTTTPKALDAPPPTIAARAPAHVVRLEGVCCAEDLLLGLLALEARALDLVARSRELALARERLGAQLRVGGGASAQGHRHRGGGSVRVGGLGHAPRDRIDCLSSQYTAVK